jgi:hypothetical protein
LRQKNSRTQVKEDKRDWRVKRARKLFTPKIQKTTEINKGYMGALAAVGRKGPKPHGDRYT